MSIPEAEEEARHLMQELYFTESGKDLCENFLQFQRANLLLIIGILKIEFSSKSGVRKKMDQYFRYIEDIVGTYMDRESIIAYKYFEDRRNIGIFRSIHKGMNLDGLYKKLNNIAWDFTIPRFMERMMLHGEGRCLIPTFLSFDNNLRELLKMYPVKGVVINMKGNEFIPISKINSAEYFQSKGLKFDFTEFQNPETYEKRNAIFKRNYSDRFSVIKDEYDDLLKIMTN
jgi:hypothetical protein